MAILQNANDILVDHDGDIVYLQADALWEKYTLDTTVLGGIVYFNSSDLGEPGVDKLLNFVDVDYIGAFNLTFYLDGIAQHTMEFGNRSSRGTTWRDYPLVKRIAFQKLKLVITSTTNTTKIYGIQVDFDVLRRRRYN